MNVLVPISVLDFCTIAASNSVKNKLQYYREAVFKYIYLEKKNPNTKKNLNDQFQP